MKQYGSKVHGDAPILEFAKSLQSIGGFTFEYIDPLAPLPAAVTAQLAAQGIEAGNRHYTFTGCAIGTSLHLWDICIGTHVVTAQRADLANYLPTVRPAIDGALE